MTVGQNIKKIRKERRETQQQFAESLGISRTYLSDIENDRTSLSNKNLNKIAKKLNVSLNYLNTGNKMLGDLSDEELKEQKFKLSKLISESKNKREQHVKDNFFNLINKDLSYLEVHFFNNMYNFYDSENQNNENNLLFISVLLQMLYENKNSNNKEAYDDIIKDFDSFLKKYLDVK